VPSSALRSTGNRHHMGTNCISLPILLDNLLFALPDEIIVSICQDMF
jgi:hypothetical protein